MWSGDLLSPKPSMTFLKSRDNKVTIVVKQIIKGTEIHVFDIAPGGNFAMDIEKPGLMKSLVPGDTVFMPSCTESEAILFFRKSGFRYTDN